MFLARDNSRKESSDLPRNCTFVESDWHILAAFWHPVAFAKDVQDKPVAVKLLDVNVVLWRTSAGISAAKDLCMHRGSRISMGRVEDDQILCPMHGLHYDADGMCTKIPSMGPDARIPPKMRLQSYLVEEKYGLVWVCLKGEPSQPTPVWSDLDDEKLQRVYIPAGTWQAAASRHVENFNDVAHFPWVHEQSFGGAGVDALPVYSVERTDYGLTFQLPYVERDRVKPDGIAHHSGAGDGIRNVIYSYELTLPFSTFLKVDCQDYEFTNYIYDTVCPVSANETRIFQICCDTTPESNAEFWIRDATQINEEDAPIVAAQCPEEVPLDLRAEIHIPADRMSVEYRRLLAEIGLGAPLSS